SCRACRASATTPISGWREVGDPLRIVRMGKLRPCRLETRAGRMIAYFRAPPRLYFSVLSLRVAQRRSNLTALPHCTAGLPRCVRNDKALAHVVENQLKVGLGTQQCALARCGAHLQADVLAPADGLVQPHAVLDDLHARRQRHLVHTIE